MFAELHHRELSGSLWGNKAARLSRAALNGFAVPPALCLTAASARRNEATVHAVATWLRLTNPAVVALRSSLHHEDEAAAAAAGRGWTDLHCAPDPRELVDRLVEAATAHPDTASFLVQEQVVAPYGGVAFHTEGRTLIEIGPSTSDVTSGEPPLCTLKVVDGCVLATGTIADIPLLTIGSLLVSTLERLQACYEFPLDVEWGYRAGAIYVFQVRPITRPLI
jgi:hypothetical protein